MHINNTQTEQMFYVVADMKVTDINGSQSVHVMTI